MQFLVTFSKFSPNNYCSTMRMCIATEGVSEEVGQIRLSERDVLSTGVVHGHDHLLQERQRAVHVHRLLLHSATRLHWES